MGISVDALRASNNTAFNQNLELKRDHKKQQQELKSLYDELEHEHKLGARVETIKLIGAALGLLNAFLYVTDGKGNEVVTQFNKLLSNTSNMLNVTSDVGKSYLQPRIQKINGELELLKGLMTDVDQNRNEAIESIRRLDRMVDEILSREQQIANKILT
ncbi:MAG: hypothetical protein SP4CHLAM5_03220 [Chlamydiia bacterium]|nr:hypothetical protein [Chlamydiia bacterium]MCH9618196.1 hypothetical protein [Chlamydiia bacterium]MCH9624081.1 hypothetical protein [Chlamydiia bacterium]